LPGLAHDKRPAAAETWLKRGGHDPAWATEALAVIERFPEWFTSAALAEVPVAAAGESEARIDRLVLTETEALILDFKTDRAVPAALADVNPEYLRQLAFYGSRVAAVFPGKTLRFALLWTAAPTLMPVPGHALAAFGRA
jgi:ATP-dependent helicase/nuclease subunit A